MFCARTYGCVKLIEGSLSRPAHRPLVHRSHVADEYADMAPRMQGRDRADAAWVAGELRGSWRDVRNREWLRHVSGPKEDWLTEQVEAA